MAAAFITWAIIIILYSTAMQMYYNILWLDWAIFLASDNFQLYGTKINNDYECMKH